VDLALVQGGTLPDTGTDNLEALASVYFEPIWIFYKGKDLDRLDALRGRRIAVGPEGSGTRALAVRLLELYGLTDAEAKTELLPLVGQDVIDAFDSGKIDAAMIVATPRSQLVHDLLARTDVEPMSLRHAEAISRNLPFLSTVTAYEGSIDLRQNLPRRSIELVAPSAMLVARSDTHEAVILLACEAAVKMHSKADLMADAGEFPTQKYLELPVNSVAEYYLKHGPSLLNRHFPFWLASLMERMTILLLPLLTLVIPLVRFAPPLYAWRIHSRIYRWYRQLRAIEQAVADGESLQDLQPRLERLRQELQNVEVPLSYMRERYDLLVHIHLLENQAAAKKKAST
jgi:hypothetical protein